MSQTMEIWLDANIVPQPVNIGLLSHARGVLRFQYTPQWLAHPLRFCVDPELTLDAGNFYPDAALGNFRVFDDSAPDRWGQTLMKRREALAAKAEGRPPQTLYAWDFFLGVQDFTRQGALRVKPVGSDTFLANDPLPAPPFAQLRELEAVGRALSGKKLDATKDSAQTLSRWLSVLVAPGASLGGARPKANFLDDAGRLWIAKFPAKDDTQDIGAWEGVVHELAVQAGIQVAPRKVLAFSPDFKTFCVQRFDRAQDAQGNVARLFYASAMALLRKDHSEGTSYLDIAEFIRQQGAAQHVQSDLEQLFKRVIFNIATSNRDDHLRNHGFILSATGWCLSPAFDMNPSLDSDTHVLNIDTADNSPSIQNAIATAEWYGLSAGAANKIADEVMGVLKGWRTVARAQGLSRGEIEVYAGAFLV